MTKIITASALVFFSTFVATPTFSLAPRSVCPDKSAIETTSKLIAEADDKATIVVQNQKYQFILLDKSEIPDELFYINFAKAPSDYPDGCFYVIRTIQTQPVQISFGLVPQSDTLSD